MSKSAEEKEQVIRLLQNNARLSNEQVAERLGMKAEQVSAIISEAETEQIIRGYRTIINEDAMATQLVRALIEVCVQPERDGGFERIAGQICRFPQVTDVLLISGNSDLQLIVEGENLREVADFVASKLAPLDGVQSTRTHFMLKRYKEAGFLYTEDEEFERLKVTP